MHRSRNQSFSSTLLDEIYNSTDLKPHKIQSFAGSVLTAKKQSINATRPVPNRKIHRDMFFGSVSSSSDSSSNVYDEKRENTRTRRSAKKSSSSNKKKPKTPASPGARIVNFINSLFSNNSSKGFPKKMSYDNSAFVRKPTDYYYHTSTTCSSASSFSRYYKEHCSGNRDLWEHSNTATEAKAYKKSRKQKWR
ncbi:hypothetical protein Rs2_27637 [Raphanus sativus]|nr:hypothetical protein Rs2_27637 [Raphanus sativus]